MAYPVTLNGRTYTLADFEGNNYVDGLPDAFEDFVTHAGDIYNDTSTTSNSIGTGSKTFTVASGKPYQAGTPLRIADAAAPATNFLDAVVTSYSGTTLVVEAIGYGGSGTLTSWTVNIGGAKTIDGTLGVSQGGTGATTAAAARTNLETYSKTEADSRFLNVSGEASDVTMTGNVTIGDAVGDTLTVNATADFNTGFNVDGTVTADGLTVDSVDINGATIAWQNAGTNQTYFSTTGSSEQALILRLDNQDLSTAGYFEIQDGSAGRKVLTAEDGGDITFYDTDGATASFVYDASAGSTFNEQGADRDFRVESDGYSSMLKVDGGGNYVGIQNAGDLGGQLNIAGLGGIRGQKASSYKIASMMRPTAFGYSVGSYGVTMLGDGNNQGTVSIGYDPSSNTSGAFTGNGGEMLFRNEMQFVTPNSANDGYLQHFKLGDSGTVFNDTSKDLDFRVESDSKTHILFVDAGNNRLGINTSTPQADFDIVRNSSTGFSNTSDQRNQMALTLRNGSEASGRFVGMNLIAGGGAQSDWSINNVWQSNYVGKLAFKTRAGANSTDWRQLFSMTANNEAVFNEDSTDFDFRVESNSLTHALFLNAGNDSISIGTSTSTNDTFLRIAGSGSKYSVKYNNAYGGGTAIYANNTNNQGWIYARFNTNASLVGYISVGTSGTSYVTSSDYRLKENVVYDWDATTRLKQLKPARFNFIVDADTTVDGFLAHEVQSVVPEAAHGTKDAVDADGNPEYQGIDQSKLVPLLVKTIQELEARITALENA